MRLLLVEDDPLSRSLMADGLRSHDFVVDEARDALSALKLFRAAPFNVVITDIALPGTDGIELAGMMRAECASSPDRQPALVALTGNPAVQAEASSRGGVFDLVLSKPICIEDIVLSLLRLPARTVNASQFSPAASQD